MNDRYYSGDTPADQIVSPPDALRPSPIHEASIIVAPPDTCPNCQRENCAAYETLYGRPMTAEKLMIQGWHDCPDCQLVWASYWRIDTLP